MVEHILPRVDSMKYANVKYNDGNGALLCNKCHIILAYGFDHVDKEHYCQPCIDNALDTIEKYARLGAEKS